MQPISARAPGFIEIVDWFLGLKVFFLSRLLAINTLQDMLCPWAALMHRRTHPEP